MSAIAGAARSTATAFIALDPGLGRLRSAAATIITLMVTFGVLFGLVKALGQPVTVAIPGVVLAMIASVAVRQTDLWPRTVTIALLAPSAMVAISLATVVSDLQLLADSVFVAVAVAAVFLRWFGPRGLAMGMVAFITYFLALFIKLKVAQLPAVAGVLVAAAVVVILMRILLQSRHPDRELRRMLSALGVRAGDVLEVLDKAVRDGGLTARSGRRLRSRMLRTAETATAVEQYLDDADGPVRETIGNEELGIRVFDFQLAIENLDTAVVRMLGEAGREEAYRQEAAAALATVGKFFENPARRSMIDSLQLSDGEASPAADADATVAHLYRALEGSVEAWRRVVDPRPGDVDALTGGTPSDHGEGEDKDKDKDEGEDKDGEGEEGNDDGEAKNEDEGKDEGEDKDDNKGVSRLGATSKQAAQVGVASALAIVVGTQLSSSRWFWAVIAAFVVYIGTSTRGEILSKGWQRILGTLAGVVAGVLIATAVGGNTIVAVALIIVCLFFGLYLMSVSSAIMMFFITTMLALVYGLLGMFTVDLLVVRLEETAAGALIGVLVSYVVFPASTRKAAGKAVLDFLEELSELLERSIHDLTTVAAPAGPAGERARTLRDSFSKLRTTAKPLTDGIAGVASRSGPRRTVQVLAVCEHHGRMLSRLADAAGGVAAEPEAQHALERASRAVRTNVEALSTGADTRMADVTIEPAEQVLDDLERVADLLAEPARRPLLAAARHLRAIDQTICTRASELGANTGSPADTDEVGTET